jgi:hypothetical protein
MSVPSWTADPPEYVGSVMLVDLGTEVHLYVDMRPKYLQPDAEVEARRSAFGSTRPTTRSSRCVDKAGVP